MEDKKFITYQGHDLDQSEEAFETFPTVGFQQRNKLTNQRDQRPRHNKDKKEDTHHQTVIRKIEMTPEMAPDHVHT